MKKYQPILAALAAIIVAVTALTGAAAFFASLFGSQAGLLAAMALLLAPASLLKVSPKLGVTLTSPQVLLDVIGAFRKNFPFLNLMGTDFRPTPLKLNQQYIAHIVGMPTASTYSTSTGYANGANSARGLLTDVTITVDQHPTCPIKMEHLNEIKDVKNRYEEAMRNAGFVLAKGCIDNILAGVTTRNFSQELVTAVADCDYDWLQTVTGMLNNRGCMPTGRVLLVSTAVANVLAVDSRMISKDYAGQLLDGNGLRQWRNVGGFALIQEYTDFPTNNGTALSAVTAEADDDLITKAAHGLVTGDPVTFISGTGFTGLTAGTRYWAITASSSTFKVATSYSNAIAGTAIDITADGSSGVFQLQENLVACAFDRRALALLTGVPADFKSTLAAQFGIPTTMLMETITEEESGMTMGNVKWQEPGTGDLYVCPTFVYGKGLGKQAATAAAGTLTDYALLRCTKGASS